MLEKARERWAQRRRRKQELDREYAAEERKLIDDPERLHAEVGEAEAAAILRNRPFRKPPGDE